jgi:hypothetical protein
MVLAVVALVFGVLNAAAVILSVLHLRVLQVLFGLLSLVFWWWIGQGALARAHGQPARDVVDREACAEPVISDRMARFYIRLALGCGLAAGLAFLLQRAIGT